MTRRLARDAAPTERRYLLDTHALIYLDQDPARLPRRVRTLMTDTDNRLFVSIASLWEMQIKVMTGTLSLTVPLDRLIAQQAGENAVDLLGIVVAHVVEHACLPDHHRDPFDRMLVAQARVEGMTLLSQDRKLRAYDVAVAW